MSQFLKITTTVIRFRVAIICITLIAVIFAAQQTFQKLRIDNSLTIWFLDDDPSYKSYIDFQNNYGSDEIFVVMIPVNNALNPQSIDTLKQLTKAVEKLSYVSTTFSLAKAKYPIYKNKSIHFDHLYNPKRSEKGLKSIFSKLPNVTSQLVSADYKNLFFYIQLKPTPTIEGSRAKIADEIDTTIKRYTPNYYITGPPVLNQAYNKGIYKESLVFGVLTVVVITIMLLFLLPSKRYLPIALICVAVPISILFGIITTFGFALNMISMLIPTILMVYSVSDAVHIINIYQKEGLKNTVNTKAQLIATTFQKSFTPCLYTTLTTFVGYFALYLSPLPAFKNMGVFTCIGLLLSYILVYIITIIGFSFLRLNFENTKPLLTIKGVNYPKLFSTINHITTRYKSRIVFGFTVLLLAGFYAISQIKTDTHSLDLLAEGKAKNDLKYIESQLKGSSRLQLNITAKNGENILQKQTLKQLQNFQEKLETNALITAPVSIVNLQSFLQKRTPLLFQSNISEQQVKHVLSTADIPDNSFFKLFSEDLTSAAITLSLREMKTSELEDVLQDITTYFNTTFNTSAYTLKINGFAVVFAQLNHFILETQFKSFFVAFFVAFLCLWHFIKSFKTTILVLIPNLLPLAVLALVMALFSIPLDVTTAMITPIMLGIAMDDTIHLVYKYRKSKRNTASTDIRINNAINYTGGALVSTTIALVGGFLIIASSDTPSVTDFGMLCAITVSVALITDVFYLPALLKTFDK